MAKRRGGRVRAPRALALALLALVLGFALGSGAAWLSGGPATPTAEGVPSPDWLSDLAASPADPAPPPVAYTSWDPEESPNYYRVVGVAQLGEVPAAGTVAYGDLDSRGRATGAVATVTYASMEAGTSRPRADMGALEPSGWGHNAEVDIAMPNGTIYHGFLFNRSHLVAKSLGGDDQLHNLICATRTENVGANVAGAAGGMGYPEELARGWLRAHPEGTLYYAATPVYEGDELVARSVIVDIRSSDGEIDQRIEIYNTALGFSIDYVTGRFSITEPAEDVVAAMGGASEAPANGGGDAPAEGEASADEGASAAGQRKVVPEGSPESEGGKRKVIVTGSGKAYHHDESCRGLANARSMEWVSVSEAQAMGRHPCGICGG